MGNGLAIYLVERAVSLSAHVEVKRKKRIERQRTRTLIPRYLARLNNKDVSITTLNLNGVGLDYELLRVLSKPLLSGGTRVQELYLERNMISPEEATCIARLLSKDRYLNNVSLAHNPVGSMGVMAIASALEQNNSLERLDLSFCNIDDDGLRQLSNSLKLNSTLKYLNLEGNCISSSGVNSLLRCVYDTTSMQSLWESNHTIRAFYGQRPIYSQSFPETQANRQLVMQLGEVMATCNRRYSAPSCSAAKALSEAKFKIAARKILRHYVKQETMEYFECVEGLEEKLVPNVIGWLVRYSDMETIYEVVRSLPWLLGRKEDQPPLTRISSSSPETGPPALDNSTLQSDSLQEFEYFSESVISGLENTVRSTSDRYSSAVSGTFNCLLEQINQTREKMFNTEDLIEQMQYAELLAKLSAAAVALKKLEEMV